MKKITLPIAIMLSLMPTLTNASEADLQKQIDAQNRSMFMMQGQIDDLNKELLNLRGEIEKLKYDLAHMNTSTSNQAATTNNQDVNNANANTNTAVDNNATNNTQVGADNTANSTVANANSANSNDKQNNKDNLKPVVPAAQKLYDEAYSNIIENNLPKAIEQFEQYTINYPDNELTPNAFYWKGQAQYKLNNYNDARVSFLNVARFNSSPKRPDSLYKLGVISQAKGEKDKAVKYFELVINTYPNDTAASFSKVQLENINKSN